MTHYKLFGPKKKRYDKGNSCLNHSFHTNYALINTTTTTIVINTFSRTWPRGLFLSQYPKSL